MDSSQNKYTFFQFRETFIIKFSIKYYEQNLFFNYCLFNFGNNLQTKNGKHALYQFGSIDIRDFT